MLIPPFYPRCGSVGIDSVVNGRKLLFYPGTTTDKVRGEFPVKSIHPSVDTVEIPLKNG